MLILGCGAFFHLNDEGHCAGMPAIGQDEVDVSLRDSVQGFAMVLELFSTVAARVCQMEHAIVKGARR